MYNERERFAGIIWRTLMELVHTGSTGILCPCCLRFVSLREWYYYKTVVTTDRHFSSYCRLEITARNPLRLKAVSGSLAEDFWPYETYMSHRLCTGDYAGHDRSFFDIDDDYLGNVVIALVDGKGLHVGCKASSFYSAKTIATAKKAARKAGILCDVVETL